LLKLSTMLKLKKLRLLKKKQSTKLKLRRLIKKLNILK